VGMDVIEKQSSKNILFEYIVHKLVVCLKAKHEEQGTLLTKLRLQKILFLVASVNAIPEELGLLQIFNNFHALRYGPVEMDIYNAMKQNCFKQIKFEGNHCVELDFLDDTRLSLQDREQVDTAFDILGDKIYTYLTMPVFDLVDLTHQWTAWQVAISISRIYGTKSEPMTSKSICYSRVKSF
jgi:hypothetical protein